MNPNNPKNPLVFLVLLLLLTTAAYSRVGTFAFVNFDDNDYVYDNPQVRQGLTLQGFRWALTAWRSGNWHPLTWLSHMLDVALFGLNAGSHHLTNLLLHLANVALLFGLMHAMTGRPWSSLMVAALFALHPLQVESVAWVAERKNVLSTFFGLAAIGAYLRFVRRPSLFRYLAVMGLMVLSLTAKAMLVTLPFVLLLIDRWPLQRWQDGRRLPLVIEKVPLLALSALVSWVAVAAQHQQGAVAHSAALSLDQRLANAVVAYAFYLKKFFWPLDLCVFYPHPGLYPPWQLWGAGMMMAGIFGLMIRSGLDGLVFGGLWYLGTLVPVIGLVQVGGQAAADRYAYIPMIGAYVALVCTGAHILDRRPALKRTLTAAAAGIVVCLTVLTAGQLGHWADSAALYRRALGVIGPHPVIDYNLANHYLQNGFPDQAIDHYRRAIAQQPDARTWGNLGLAHFRSGQADHAETCYRNALGIDPNHSPTHNNLAMLRWYAKDLKSALDHWQKAINALPTSAVYRDNFGLGLITSGDPGGALMQFQCALVLDPQLASARRNLERTLAIKETLDQALAQLQDAVAAPCQAVGQSQALRMAKQSVDDAVAQYRERIAGLPGFDPRQVDIRRYEPAAKALTAYETAIRGWGR